MKINEVEQLVGITKKNIRFYEDQGLLSPDRNKENGYRDYTEQDVNTLQRIKLMRKLGLSIEEIRLMQAGKSTVADSMRRHLVTLEREKHNLSQSELLCTRLKETDGTLSNLDAQKILAEMDQMETQGTAFKNKQREDIKIRYAVPVIAALVMVVLMAASIGVLLWAFNNDPAGAPPIPFMVVVIMIPGLVIAGVLIAMVDRLREIQKGEIDDAKKY